MNRIGIDLGALTVLFIGLKVTGNIHWPWWKVIAPTVLDVAIQLFLHWRKGE